MLRQVTTVWPGVYFRRQIEFIGDSWTAGYGDMSTSNDCSAPDVLTRNSNANQAFGAITARGLGADYQINAWVGSRPGAQLERSR